MYTGNTEAEHQAIVEKVLQQCVEHRLAVNLLKSKFQVKETIFLEYVINRQQVKMHPSKLEAMSKWHIHKKEKEVQTFLGFANYYHQFIFNYSTNAPPLIDLTKDVPFTWGQTQQQAFNKLRV